VEETTLDLNTEPGLGVFYDLFNMFEHLSKQKIGGTTRAPFANQEEAPLNFPQINKSGE